MCLDTLNRLYNLCVYARYFSIKHVCSVVFGAIKDRKARMVLSRIPADTI